MRLALSHARSWFAAGGRRSPVRFLAWTLAFTVGFSLVPSTVSAGNEAGGNEAGGNEAETPTASADVQGDSAMSEHYAAFAELLSGSTLVGHFTMPAASTEDGFHEERYEIRSVKKSERGDFWLFIARVKYGDHDITLPMPLEVKWAGTTPVITLDSVTIPKLGTFDARVVIDGKQYAGTWRHGDVGGHMFGRIETKADQETQGQSNGQSNGKES